MLKDFKKYLKDKSDKNFNFVKARKLHTCNHCLRTIELGWEYLTINPKRGARRSYCEKCVRLMLDVSKAKSFYNSTSFGDEGGAYACLDWIFEVESELEARRRI